MKRMYYIGYMLCLLLTGCVVGEKADGLLEQRLSDRTLLVYMGGDNDLADETDEKLSALAEAWDRFPGHLLIYQDKKGADSTRLLEVCFDEQGEKVTKILAKYKQENSASASVFARVVNEAMARYPSVDPGLIVFSHTSGWLPVGTAVVPGGMTRSVVKDNHSEMTLQDFASAIPDGQFNFILFEGCFMAGLEVAYELKDKTQYVVGSSAEMLSPGFTPVYKQMFPLLYKKEADLSAVAAAYYDYYNNLEGDYRSATISVIRTNGLEMLKSQLRAAESRVERWEWIDRSGLQSFDRLPDGQHLFYDASAYVERIGSAEESAAFDEALEKAIIYKAATENFMSQSRGGFSISDHCGMTLYIPDATAPALLTERKKLKLMQ